MTGPTVALGSNVKSLGLSAKKESLNLETQFPKTSLPNGPHGQFSRRQLKKRRKAERIKLDGNCLIPTNKSEHCQKMCCRKIHEFMGSVEEFLDFVIRYCEQFDFVNGSFAISRATHIFHPSDKNHEMMTQAIMYVVPVMSKLPDA